MKIAARVALLLLPLMSCGSEDPCDAFVADTTTCYDGYCDGDGDGTAFCDCWSQGMDLSTVDCSCVPRDLEVACELFDLSEYQTGDLDCAAASDAVSNVCAG